MEKIKKQNQFKEKCNDLNGDCMRCIICNDRLLCCFCEGTGYHGCVTWKGKKDLRKEIK